MTKTINKIKGCIIAGAVGDALGYPIEFLKYENIINKFGKDGLTNYVLDNDKALISDDTQLTLFTAVGLLNSINTVKKPNNKIICEYVNNSYLDWLKTQNYIPHAHTHIDSILDNVVELNKQRAPGDTCLSALLSGKAGKIGKPRNQSCGCGGLMRVAPCAILFPDNYQLSAEVATITHGHPLGYLPAEMMHYIISNLLNTNLGVSKVIDNSINYISNKYIRKFTLNKTKKFESESAIILANLINLAVNLSKQNQKDNKAISILGLGFVAHEALAIAIYSCLKYENDLEKALICSVNHDGDSDSTGSIAGNILGASLGYDKIPAKFLKNLELHDLICEVAEKLYSSNNSN